MKNNQRKKRLSCLYDAPFGADFSEKPAGELCRIENMYVDYEGGGDCVESIPGFRVIYSFKKKIHRIFLLDGEVFIHAGEGLYRFKKEERDSVRALTPVLTLKNARCPMARLDNSLLILSEGRLIRLWAGGESMECDAPEEIARCTRMVVLGGRLLLSGSRKMPRRVYFTDFDSYGAPIFALDGYFDAAERVNSMLASGGKLLLFTKGGVFSYRDEGGVFLPEESLGGIDAERGICFLDEILFTSDTGLISLDGAKCLSDKVNPLLLSGEVQNLTTWRGYLALCRRGEIFLADPRRRRGDGSDRFDWYYLCRIGSYKGDSRLFRYGETAEEGYATHPLPHSVCEGEAMSLIDESGRTIYYCEENGVKYSIYPTGERVGGVFYPATEFASDGELLYFATESGDLCLFNSDMRAAPPPYLKEQAGFDEGEYRRLNSRRIHPYFYSFANHAPEYRLVTRNDSLSLPFTKKNTLAKSLKITAKCFSKSNMELAVICDGVLVQRSAVRAGCAEFSEVDFSASPSGAESVTVTLPEHQNGWVSKQIAVYGREFCSPIGIYSLSYQYKTTG